MKSIISERKTIPACTSLAVETRSMLMIKVRMQEKAESIN